MNTVAQLMVMYFSILNIYLFPHEYLACNVHVLHFVGRVQVGNGRACVFTDIIMRDGLQRA